jgi:hypothetical protein
MMTSTSSLEPSVKYTWEPAARTGMPLVELRGSFRNGKKFFSVSCWRERCRGARLHEHAKPRRRYVCERTMDRTRLAYSSHRLLHEMSLEQTRRTSSVMSVPLAPIPVVARGL